MSASLIPNSGGNPSNWWNDSRLFLIGGAVAGGSQIHRNAAQNHHEKCRRCERQQDKLRTGRLNPAEFVSQQGVDRYRPSTIKSRLQLWGETWEGTSFKDADSFSVEPKHKGWLGPLKLAIDPSYELKIKGVDPKDAAKDVEGKSKRRGLRGGATPQDENQAAEVSLEAQPFSSSEVAKEHLTSIMENEITWGPDLLRRASKASAANPVYQLCEDSPTKWKTYTIAADPPPITGTLFGSMFLSFAVLTASLVAWEWAKQHFARDKDRNNSGKGLGFKNVDNLRETSDAKLSELASTGIDSVMQATMASDSLLKVLTAFHQETITKDVALFLMKTYHNQTEDEARALLDQNRRR